MNATQDHEPETLQNWLCEHVAFGRLDELSNRHLTEIMFCPFGYNIAGAVVLSAKDFPVPDDSIELMARSTANLMIPECIGDVHKYAKVARSWCVFEGFRRLGHVEFDNDVLIRELGDPMAARITWLIPPKKISELCIKWGEVLEAHMAQFKG